MVSTERVLEYSKLEPETDVEENKNLPESWPHQGAIVAHNASYSYHETLPTALTNLNFKIKPREKVS